MPALFNVFINMHRKHHNNCQLLVFRYTECHYCRSKNISRQKPLTASVTPSKRTEFPSFKLGLIQNHPGRANSFSYRKLQRSPNLSHSVSIYMNPGQAFGVIKSKQLPRSWDSPVMHLAGGERSGVSPFQSWPRGKECCSERLLRPCGLHSVAFSTCTAAPCRPLKSPTKKWEGQLIKVNFNVHVH